jgi:hypothetical protein
VRRAGEWSETALRPKDTVPLASSGRKFKIGQMFPTSSGEKELDPPR